MRTLETATRILASRPKEAMNDAVGFAAMAGLIFAGFLVPAFL